MDTIFPWLVGHRTQVLALAGALVEFLASIGVVDRDTANHVIAVITPVAVATFSAKVDRIPNQIATATTTGAAPPPTDK